MNPHPVKPAKLLLQILLPLLVLACSALAAFAIIQAKPKVEKRLTEVLPPLVRTTNVTFTSHRFVVESQGTVAPRTESLLVPEVSGRVEWVSPSFVDGGFFDKDQSLFRIDKRDFEEALTRARADVAVRELALAREQAEADLAAKEWRDLGRSDEEANPLTLHVPQLNEARAALDSARAALDLAKRNLERTEIRAPYRGRVRQKQADVGQYVSRGAAVATLYAVDAAEVRLPLPDEDLAFLDLPLVYREESPAEEAGPRVRLKAQFAGKEFSWEGRVVRTEGEIDPSTRMVHAVAEVEDPYARGEDSNRPPLAVGLYVRAEIEGIVRENVAVLPRAALHGKDRVWVVDTEDSIRFRDVALYRATREEIMVRSGLAEGERICLSQLEAVTDGMRVRVAGAAEDASKETAGENP